ncbi:MAG: glycoside hydrolase, partial [Halobacteriales archaeon]|nr:glycoside hydrolase [Halobacteriales archaeon]
MRPVALGVLALLLTGCVSSSTPPLPGPGAVVQQVTGLAFGASQVLSVDHAGGEPAIIVTPQGTLLYAAHPGYTHTHGLPSADLLTSTTYESYMWRSTDQGATWSLLGAAAGMGPRGPGRGISDPDFAVDGKGRVFFTDLNALATDTVSRSDDDGATWLFANNAVQTLIDRQWLAAYQDSVWIKGNTDLRGIQVLRSDDGGLTWAEVGQAHVGGKMSSDPRDGTLYAGNGARVDVSTDGGKTWTLTNVSGHKNGGRELGQVAVDGAGTAYTAWAEGHDVWFAASKDKGASWLAPVRLTSQWNGATNGTHLWPWVAAGSAGRIGVVWYAADESVDNAQDVKGAWWVEAAEVLGADTAEPQWQLAGATGTVHTGP